MKFEEYNLELINDQNSVKVTQNDQSYLARNWTLSDDVVKHIKICLEYGLTCMIQNSHPSSANRLPLGKGTVYLSFSRAQNEFWVVTFNDFSSDSKRPFSNIKKVLINKIFRFALTNAGIPWITERGRSAANIVISNYDLENAIKACRPYFDNLLPRKGKSNFIGKYDGFSCESDIEKWLIESIDRGEINDELGIELDIIANQYKIKGGIIDILCRCRNTKKLVIIEVKQRRSQNAVLEEQLPRYLENVEIKQLAKNNEIIGCLIAEEIPEKHRLHINSSNKNLVGFEIKRQSKGNVEVKKVAGNW